MNTPKFSDQNAKVTVAEVYKVEIMKGTVYADYVYEVESKLYKSGGGHGVEFRNWKSPEIRKYPVIYNVENPKISFLLSKHRLPDSLVIGMEIDNKYLNNESLKTRMLTQTVSKAYDEPKYFKEYFEIKRKLKSNE